MINVKISISSLLVNELLSNVFAVAEVGRFKIQINTSTRKYSATRRTTLAQTSGQVVNGFLGISQTRDNLGVGIETFTPIVRPTTSVPQVGSLLIGNVSNSSSLGNITGGTVGNGDLNEVIMSGSPRSIKTVLTDVTGTKPNYSSVVESTVPTDLQDVGEESYNQIDETNNGDTTAIINNVQTDIQSFGSSLDNSVDKKGSGLLDNVALVGNDYVETEIRSVTLPEIPQEVITESTTSIIVDKKPVDAIEKITPYKRPDVTVEELEDTIVNIPTSPSTTITTFSPETDDFGSTTEEIKEVNPSSPQLWEGRNTDLTTYKFTEVSSVEELVAEFRGMTREVTEFVLHWTAHFNNQGHIGAKEIHEIAIQNQKVKFDGCMYHYIIKKNGVIERGRPVNIKGAHTLNGHNNLSIAVAFVAGYNCNSGNSNYKSFISAESITQAQYNSFNNWCKAFYAVWPGGQAFGHNDTDPGRKVDPGFNVPEYVKTKFSKENVIAASQGPLTSQQLTLIA